MMTFLLVVHGLLALALVGVILMQKSEGGGLTGGGSAGGLVSARGAADLLTRTTAVLATLFIGSSLALAMLAAGRTSSRQIDTSLARTLAEGTPGQPAPAPAPAPAPSPALPPLGAPPADGPAVAENAPATSVPLAK